MTSYHRCSLAPHVDGLNRGELMISTCVACGRAEFPPRMHCRACGDARMPAWTPCGGSGRLWSFAAFHKAYLPEFPLVLPYVVAVIELDEGVRMYANVIGTPMSELHVGQTVVCEFGAADGVQLSFRTADEETP